jgi:hypothetical protein
MTMECYKTGCKKHLSNYADSYDDGPFCCEEICKFERKQKTVDSYIIAEQKLELAAQRKLLKHALDAMQKVVSYEGHESGVAVWKHVIVSSPSIRTRAAHVLGCLALRLRNITTLLRNTNESQ